MKINWGALTGKEREKLVKEYKKTTGPIACEKQGVNYTTARNRLSEIAPKGMGRGGKRPGAGNKPGVKFCPTCRKKAENCTCE
jgi:ribosomal protein L33